MDEKINTDKIFDRLLTIKDLEKYFSCSRKKATQIMGVKTFPSMKIGRNYYVSRINLETWVDKNKRSEIVL